MSPVLQAARVVVVTGPSGDADLAFEQRLQAAVRDASPATGVPAEMVAMLGLDVEALGARAKTAMPAPDVQLAPAAEGSSGLLHISGGPHSTAAPINSE
jgi:hypothetical protein